MVMLQGNTCWLAVRVEDCEGKVVSGERVAKGRFEVGGLAKYYGEGGEVVWNEQMGVFLVPLSEEETFSFSGTVDYQARLVLDDGTVCGSVPKSSMVYASLSKEIIGDGGYGAESGKVLTATLVNYVQGTGTVDYEKLKNKPSINGVELIGDKTTQELGIVSEESDPTVPSHVKAISEQDISNWNGKVSQEQLEETNKNITLLEQNKADVSYVEQKVADLVNSAPDMLDTLGEVANAIKENEGVITALNDAINNKADKAELDNYVKTTDYATGTQAGLVKANSNQGFFIGSSGDLSIVQATDADLVNKTNKFRPITANNLDKAIKSGLTTNTVELTEEEQAKAKAWLGISANENIPLFSATQLEDGSYSITMTTNDDVAETLDEIMGV